MKRFSILSAAAIAALAACGGSSKPPTFKQPAGTAAVNFSVDDTANKVYTIRLNRNNDLLDPFLRIEDANFVQLAEDDDSGQDLNSLLTFRPHQ